MKKVDILGVKVDNVIREELEEIISERKIKIIMYVNTNSINIAQKDKVKNIKNN